MQKQYSRKSNHVKIVALNELKYGGLFDQAKPAGIASSQGLLAMTKLQAR
jgi:hypothetical protein